jgi:hypothetical protein
MDLVEQIENSLVDKYSHLMGIEELASVLGISHRAAQIADQRGTLPVEMKKLPGRKKKIIPASVVAEYLASLES